MSEQTQKGENDMTAIKKFNNDVDKALMALYEHNKTELNAGEISMVAVALACALSAYSAAISAAQAAQAAVVNSPDAQAA